MVWDLLKQHNPTFFEQGESGREAAIIEIRRLQALDAQRSEMPGDAADFLRHQLRTLGHKPIA